MSEQTLDRRQFLARAAVLGLAAAGLPTLLSACKSGGGGELSCIDTSGLTEAQIQTRQSLHYVEASPRRDQTCANCAQYVAPAQQGNCGTCQIVPGPINPAGRCDNWTART